jgi:hypothetical protein
MMSNTPTTDTSPLLQRIAQAIERCQPRQGRLHVSVARDASWEKSTSSSDEVRVRWLCWSIEDGDKEIVPPEFEVLHQDVTEERLRNELPGLFPMLEVVVDDDIDI